MPGTSISEHNHRNSSDREVVTTILCEKLQKELNHVIWQPYSLACQFHEEYAGTSIRLVMFRKYIRPLKVRL
jgi:hypothetical protein